MLNYWILLFQIVSNKFTIYSWVYQNCSLLKTSQGCNIKYLFNGLGWNNFSAVLQLFLQYEQPF